MIEFFPSLGKWLDPKEISNHSTPTNSQEACAGEWHIRSEFLRVLRDFRV
jgi:hypothetical protein